MVRPDSKKQRSAAKSIQAQKDTNAYLRKIAQQGQVADSSHAAYEVRSTFKCSDCAELIMIEAKKCRFCGLQFSEIEVEERIKNQNELESSSKEDEPQGVAMAFMEGLLGDDKAQEFRSRISKFVSNPKAQEFRSRISDLVSDPKENQIANPKTVVESEMVTIETHSECPNCQQMILNTASICRHCQKSVK
jgi:predicted RNA-binding Zn-ribbon protein involved in translation (DUF1610 family)